MAAGETQQGVKDLGAVVTTPGGACPVVLMAKGPGVRAAGRSVAHDGGAELPGARHGVQRGHRVGGPGGGGTGVRPGLGALLGRVPGGLTLLSPGPSSQELAEEHEGRARGAGTARTLASGTRGSCLPRSPQRGGVGTRETL